MSARVINLALRMVAVTEGERLTGFLKAIDVVRKAQATCAAFDTPGTADSAAARDALDACVVAEDRLLAPSCDPGLATFLAHVLEHLNDITGEVTCA